jgi:tetratricopeptide (TPR) repeat protein
MRVFLSAVSNEFRSYRKKLAHQLKALKNDPCQVKVQEDFQQGGFTLLDKLTDYVRECDLVIHLAGDACGACPTSEHVIKLFHSLGAAPPDPLPDWSYTQWEYQLAQRFERKALVYFAAPDTQRDCELPVPQEAKAAQRQHEHCRNIKQSGKAYSGFSSYNTLIVKIFHDLGLQPELKINNLPYKSLGSLFKGRDDLLRKTHDTLRRAELSSPESSATDDDPPAAVVVHGLGGSGKTRTTIEYAHRHAVEYTALLFVNADSPAGLQQNLAALCGPKVLDLPAKDAKEIDVQVAGVLHWLQQHVGWLLIFDNADAEEAAQAVQDLLGQLTSSGQVLVTSRLSNWPDAVKPLSLDVLEEAAAAEFLLERTNGRRRKTPEDASQARAAAVELGQLALALEQAGAYIAKNRFTFTQYLVEWQGQRDKVLAWFDKRLMQYAKSVAVTWQTSFDSLSEPAQRLLHVLAWLAPDPIPESLLEAGGGPFAVEDADQPGVALSARDALADLDAYSLVTRAEDFTFTVHRLVQDVTRRSGRVDGDQMYLKAALRWVEAAFVGDPQDVRSWPVLVPLAPHALTVARYADSENISRPTAWMMNGLGVLYFKRAQYAEAESLLRRALAINEKAYGLDHADVASNLNELGLLLESTNRLDEAERLLRRALAINEKAYGPDHVDAASLNNLGLVLQRTNRLGEAEQLQRRVLAILEQTYGPDHPNVAVSLNNLAQLLKVTNRLGEAEALMRRTLVIDEKSYGADHPNVARDLNNLGALLHSTSRLAEAEPQLRRALEIDQRFYGPYHPDVARDLSNLAQLLQDTTRPGEAEALMRRALETLEKVNGPEHPDVAVGLNNLAMFLYSIGQPGEVEALIRRALAIDEMSYGPDHPDVARDLNNLARFLQETGRPGEVETLMGRTVEIFTKAYGSDHPNVAVSLGNLANFLYSKNRPGEAEPLMRQALAIDDMSYGPDHPNVARDLINLGALLGSTNRPEEAEQQFRRALEILFKSTRDTGDEHPYLQQAMINYVTLLENNGYPEQQAHVKLNAIARRYGFSF